MRTFKIVCRNSRLSLVQANIARNYFLKAFSNLQIEIITKETSGDLNMTQPLYELEGRDFFSKEIDEYLLSGKADFSIHSMKDLSAERIEDKRFIGAVLERNDPRDVAIFNKNCLGKIEKREPLTLGTSSLRRQEQALKFLWKALPKLNGNSPTLSSKPIRGNVDSRLQQLKSGKFDGIILAAAGLNRLLGSEENKSLVKELLSEIRLMFLPLIECSPAPAQGALLAEALAENTDAVEILKKVNNDIFSKQLKSERDSVSGFGGGCHQKYGAVYIDYGKGGVINISGIDSNGNDVSDMLFDMDLDLTRKKLFSAADFSKDFFTYDKGEVVNEISEEVVFVSSHKAVTDDLISMLQSKKVWAAGSRTWAELANKGIWCQGCADGFGFHFLDNIWASPLLNVTNDLIIMLTNIQSALHWKKAGLKAIGVYELVPSITDEVKYKVSNAEVIFWTSFQQYNACKTFLKKEVVHLCPSGKTADLLMQEGIQPKIFPTIKAFNLWRKKSST